METGFYTQDTVGTRLIIHINTNKLLPDSVFRKMDEIPGYMHSADSGTARKIILPKVSINDTTSVCARNSIADVTFSDSLSIIRDIRFIPAGRVSYPDNAGKTNAGLTVQPVLINDLREGTPVPMNPLHNDFITLAVFFAAFVLISVRSAFKKTIPEITRFFLFRGIGDSQSRDVSAIFSWYSTIVNFISFLIISMFVFSALAVFDLIPAAVSPVLFLLILFGIVVFGITSRHLICAASGELSGKTEIFNEYLVTVYQSYRFGSMVLYPLLILMNYTPVIPQKILVAAGIATLVIFYIFRTLRLFLIFIKRDISILYLILYLCALEFLPVMILAKYFSGLF